jgi:hypothetical protein
MVLSHCAILSDAMLMSVGQPLPWAPVPERNHLGVRLALLPFRRELSRRGRADGGTRSAGQLRNGPTLVRQVRQAVCRWPEKATRSKRGLMASGRSLPQDQRRHSLPSGERLIRTVLSSTFWFNRNAIVSPRSGSFAGSCGQLGANRGSLLLTSSGVMVRRNEW